MKGFPMVPNPKIKKDIYSFPKDYISLKKERKINSRREGE